MATSKNTSVLGEDKFYELLFQQVYSITYIQTFKFGDEKGNNYVSCHRFPLALLLNELFVLHFSFVGMKNISFHSLITDYYELEIREHIRTFIFCLLITVIWWWQLIRKTKPDTGTSILWREIRKLSFCFIRIN